MQGVGHVTGEIVSVLQGLAQTAKTMLATYGQELTFTRRDSGTYTPATGVMAYTETTFKGSGAVTSYRSYEIDGTRILATDKKISCEALDTTPIMGDVVTANATDYRVLNVEIKAPAGVDIAYILQARV